MKKNNNNLDENFIPKVLVISALPITKSASTRAFYTYLPKFPKENIAQIYTNTSQPTDFDICDNYFQITDSMLLKNRLHKNATIGRIINSKSNIRYELSKSTKKLISFGKKNYPIVDLIRNKLWKKKKYINVALKDWINSFNPDVIFFHNSSALFIEKMCLYVADLTNKPFILEIADDYYFGKKFSISPFYYIHRKKYKKTFNSLINKSSEQIYVSDKMKYKYNSHFSKDGTTIFISSEISKKENLNDKIKKVGYFGNTGLGRMQSLEQISSSLKRIDDSINIDVYCPNLGNSKEDKKTNNIIRYKGFVKYEDLANKIKEYDLLLFIESFKKKVLSETKYSLSTKVGDYLSSGIPVLAFGPKESGSIGFLLDNKCAYLCTDKKEINTVCKETLSNNNSRSIILSNASKISKEYFDIQINSQRCFDLINKCVSKK